MNWVNIAFSKIKNSIPFELKKRRFNLNLNRYITSKVENKFVIFTFEQEKI